MLAHMGSYVEFIGFTQRESDDKEKQDERRHIIYLCYHRHICTAR